MSEKEKEEMQLNASKLIMIHGDTPDVKKFLKGCALNLALMKEKGDNPNMKIELNGTTLVLTLQ